MNTKHTPGPWVVKNGHSETNTFVWQKGGDLIASVTTGENARLIAAAPDMADALRAVAEFWAGGDAPDELTEQVNAALAKAGL